MYNLTKKREWNGPIVVNCYSINLGHGPWRHSRIDQGFPMSIESNVTNCELYRSTDNEKLIFLGTELFPLCVKVQLTNERWSTALQCGGIQGADFETAVTATGYGKFNYLLLLGIFLPTWASIFDVSNISMILPSAECDLDLSLFHKGVLNASVYAGECISLCAHNIYVKMRNKDKIKKMRQGRRRLAMLLKFRVKARQRHVHKPT